MGKSETERNIEKLGKLFPGCVTDVTDADGTLRRKVDLDRLRELLPEDMVTAEERYGFTWVGKKAALAEARSPVRKRLLPCAEESVDWDNTGNLYIEGDNLDVLKLLRENYLGKIKLIYIDPPYNTGSDFTYHDNFSRSAAVHTKKRGRTGGTDASERLHSDWCSIMYSRLLLARELLTVDGVIFISIDEHEVTNLKMIANEVFGEKNCVGCVIWERAFAPKNDSKYFSDSHDYILVYATDISSFKIGKLPRTEKANARYRNPDNDPRGAWTADNLTVKTYCAANDYPVTTPGGRVVNPSNGSCWRVNRDRFRELVEDGRVYFGSTGNNVPRLKRFLSEVREGMTPTTIWKYTEVGHNQEGRQELKKLFDGKGYFDGPKPVRLLTQIIRIANTGKDSVILDFFSGSAAAAQAVMETNAEDGGHRRFIMVQLPEPLAEDSNAYRDGYRTICDIGKERIRRAGKKICSGNGEAPDCGFRVYRLADSDAEDT